MVIDNDMIFKIDAETMAITCDGPVRGLNQGDHRSERYSFTVPRYIEGYDISKCNKVEAHYTNIHIDPETLEPTINKSFDEVQDFTPTEDAVTFTWLVAGDATQLSGTLNFCIRFATMDGDKIEYQKFTDMFTGISVGETIWNTEAMAKQYADVLEKWRQEMMAEIRNGLATKITAPSAAVGQTIVVKAVDENGVPTEWEAADLPDSGGNVDYVGVEPAEDDIPKVFVNGAIPSVKTDMLAEMQYISKTETFSAYLLIKSQGNSSLYFPKKNFTIKMYSDETRETKLKKSFKDWEHETNKYVLKANYVDHTHARNIVCANLWSQIIESRTDYETLPIEMQNSPRNGAVDGFPIKLYTNGTYQGIYTWNIGKDDWMWGMDEDNASHVLLCAESNNSSISNPCFFNALWDGSDTYWSVEVGTYSDSVKSSLNELIACVMDTDDATFKATVGNYIDVQSVIDYAILQNAVLGKDGAAKNMLLATYDGVKWYCGAYDMDLVFGQKLDFTLSDPPTDHWWGWSSNLLFNRIKKMFAEDVIHRNHTLRENVLSTHNMINQFERFTDVIGNDLYEEDLEVYPNIPTIVGSTKHVRNFIKEREWYADRTIETPLYTLVDGYRSFDNGYTVAVENNAEICIRTSGDAWVDSTGAVNISNIEQNLDTCPSGDNHWHRPEIFKLYTGDVVRIVLSVDNRKIDGLADALKVDNLFYGELRFNASDVETPYKYKQVINWSLLGYFAPHYDYTFVMDSDFSVGSISCHPNRSMQFKFKIYVNGVRYI